MIDVFEEFLKFKDLKIGKLFMERIVFIVNILNMFVVVCEVLIYIGIIIVEYFCD